MRWLYVYVLISLKDHQFYVGTTTNIFSVCGSTIWGKQFQQETVDHYGCYSRNRSSVSMTQLVASDIL